MRNLERQKQDLWFCDFKEVKAGLRLKKTYSKPEKHEFSVSATSGVVFGYGAGLVASYDRYITSYERDFHPKEGTCVFVDVIPEMDEEGNLVLLEDGVSPVTAPDYTIDKILDTQKGTVARYGITKVGGVNE